MAKLHGAADAVTAAKMELDAALNLFEAAVIRDDPALIQQRTLEAQNATQRWLDAVSGKYALARKIYL